MRTLDRMPGAAPRASTLTARTGALLVTRTGEDGGVDVVRIDAAGTQRTTSTIPLPFASFATRGHAAGTFHVLTGGPAEGGLVTIALDADGLRVVARTTTGGTEPCHLAAIDDRTLAVANYTSGDIAVFDVDDAGIPHRVDLLALPGSGPDPERQTASHPHFVWADEAGVTGTAALVIDLGADRIRSLRRGADGAWTLTDTASLPAGTGPRHAAVVDGAIVVSGELSGEVVAAPLDALSAQSRVVSSARRGDGPVYPGDIVALPGGVAVANRARDSITLLDVSPSGALTRRAEVRLDGNWPHQLGADGANVLALEQRSGRLVRLDPRSGAVDVVLTGLGTPSWALDLDEEEQA